MRMRILNSLSDKYPCEMKKVKSKTLIKILFFKVRNLRTYNNFEAKDQEQMNPYSYNYGFSPFGLPYPPYLYLKPPLSYPFLGAFSESPGLMVKIQADAQGSMIKTKEGTRGERNRKKSSKNRRQREKQESIEENSTYQKYNDFNKNVLPNNIHLVLSYIRRTNKSGAIVDKIIRRLGHEHGVYSRKKFFSYQTYVKEKLASIKYNNMIEAVITHIDPTSTVFSMEEQTLYNKISRILILNFLREGALLNVLSSTKITKTKKDEHIKIQRYIIEKIQALR